MEGCLETRVQGGAANWQRNSYRRVPKRRSKWHPLRKAAGQRAGVPEGVCHAQQSAVHLQSKLQAVAANQAKYPPIKLDHPGLEVVNVEPPVYLIHGFLTPDECDSMKAAALAGSFKPAEYRDAVLIDYDKLWPLIFVVLVGCIPSVYHAVDDGGSWVDVARSALTSFSAWSLIILGMITAVKTFMEFYVQGKVFTGMKWTVQDLTCDDGLAWSTYQKFCSQAANVLCTTVSKLEIPTITRYEVGEFQRVHTDARPVGDSEGSEEFLKAGGQRLVQFLVYLNTMPKEAGGGTEFTHPTLKGLVVQPRQGSVLVFFPAFADGTVDHRMPHAGSVVKAGEKWIFNTWAMQFERPGATVASPEFYYD